MIMMGELAKELAAVYQSLVRVAACAEKERAAENVSAEEAVITKALQTSQSGCLGKCMKGFCSRRPHGLARSPVFS